MYQYNLTYIPCTYKLSNSIDAGYDDASYAHHATLNPDHCYQQQRVEYQQRLDVCSSKLE